MSASVITQVKSALEWLTERSYHQSVFFVVPTQTTAQAALTVTNADIKSYYDGLTLAIRLPFANVASTTIAVNSLGAKPVYYQNNSTIAGVIPANTVCLVIYETKTVSTGCWKLVYSYSQSGSISNGTISIGGNSISVYSQSEIDTKLDAISDAIIQGFNDVADLSRATFLPLTGGNITGDLTINGREIPSMADLEGFIPVEGARGAMKGWGSATTSSASTFEIRRDIADDIVFSNPVTISVPNGLSTDSWIKCVSITNASGTQLTNVGSGWNPQDDSGLTIEDHSVITFYWHGSFGVISVAP